MIEGIYPVYKPAGPTSHDVVQAFKRICGQDRVGHAGTLDPLASGVLIIGAGRAATKKLSEFLRGEKEYRAVIRLGQNSATDDAEGTKLRCLVERYPAFDQARSALDQFVGQIKQTPPIYSAVKKHGRPAYAYARRGQNVVLEPRPALIKAIELISYDWPDLTIRVVTGSGVYIRTLARDIGRALRTGGFIAQLERTRVGKFTIDQALTIDQWRDRLIK
jgi:tRNA pseudouridine55 synthase